MIIRKYNEFIMESFYGDIFQRLAQFNIPDLNYLLNQLISKENNNKYTNTQGFYAAS